MNLGPLNPILGRFLPGAGAAADGRPARIEINLLPEELGGGRHPKPAFDPWLMVPIIAILVGGWVAYGQYSDGPVVGGFLGTQEFEWVDVIGAVGVATRLDFVDVYGGAGILGLRGTRRDSLLNLVEEDFNDSPPLGYVGLEFLLPARYRATLEVRVIDKGDPSITFGISQGLEAR